MTLGKRFDPRNNGLNFLRLVLATSVIVWHAYPLSGRDVESAALQQFMEATPVDGFFAISGFLIASSWIRRPHAWPFIWARILRIFPGFLACLVVTAAVLAPIGLLLSGEGIPNDYLGGAIGYVVKNGSLNMFQYDIAGTPAGVPYPGVWDGSLWTLRWEFLCYLGILILGLVGALNRSWVLSVLFVVAVAGLILVGYGPLGGDTLTNLTRFGVMYLAGTLVYVFRNRLPGSVWWSIPAVVVIGASLFLHSYQIIAAPFLAYLLINLGAHIRTRWLRLENDISYGVYIYAFPIAQILVGLGMANVPIVWFMLATIVLTVPLAIASWFAVEKPAMRLRHLRRPRTVQEVAVAERT